MKKQTKIENEYGEVIGTAYDPNASTAQVFTEHLSVVDDLAQAENGNYKGKKTVVWIIKAGRTKQGNVWILGKMQGGASAGALWLKTFEPQVLTGLLQGINGVYVAEVYDSDGFPCGYDLFPDDAKDLTERLKGNRVLLLDDEPVAIRA